MIPELEDQLMKFWSLWHDAIKLWRQSPDSYHGFNWWNIDSDLLQRMIKTDAEANEVVISVRNNPQNQLVIHALLNTHVARTEAIEYVMRVILEQTIKTFSLNSKYNIAELCSVTNMVPKGKKWRSDVRAIRDAISHKRYLVSIGKNGCTVTFSNTEDGYNFIQSYSSKELIHFFDKHTFLYKTQIMLLNVIELLCIFANYLCIES